VNGSFGSSDIYVTSPEGTFCPLFFFFDKNIFDVLEKALLFKKKLNLNILHKIQLIENKKF